MKIIRISRIPRLGSLASGTLLLAGLAGLLPAGCSLLPSQQTIAEVGARRLFVKEYGDMLAHGQGGITPPDSIHRRMMVDNWVDRAELALAAEALKLDTLPDVRKALAALYDNALGEELYRRDVTRKVHVSDADLKELWGRQKDSRVVSHILAGTQADAESVSRDLAGGKSFEEVAMARSLDRASAMRGGVLGEVAAGNLPLEVEEALFKLKEGGVTPPLKEPNGFEILKVVKINPQTPQPFDKMKPQLQQMARRRAEYKLMVAKVDNLKTSRKFNIQDSDIAAMSRRFEQIRRDSGDGDPKLTPQELTATLARFTGGPYTLGDLMSDLRQTPMNYHPDVTNPGALRQYIEGRCALRLFSVEGRDQHLERSPELAARLQSGRDELLARAELQRMSLTLPKPGEADLRAQFEARKGEFDNNGQGDVLEIVTPIEKDAVEAAREARSNMGFAELQHRYSKPGPDLAKTEGRTILYFDGTKPQYEDSLRGRQPGAIVGPLKDGDHYVVMQVRAVYPPMHQTFDSARNTLEQRVLQASRTEALKAHLEELKKRVPPKVRLDLMMKARPTPPSKDGQAEGDGNA